MLWQIKGKDPVYVAVAVLLEAHPMVSFSLYENIGPATYPDFCTQHITGVFHQDGGDIAKAISELMG